MCVIERDRHKIMLNLVNICFLLPIDLQPTLGKKIESLVCEDQNRARFARGNSRPPPLSDKKMLFWCLTKCRLQTNTPINEAFKPCWDYAHHTYLDRIDAIIMISLLCYAIIMIFFNLTSIFHIYIYIFKK